MTGTLALITSLAVELPKMRSAIPLAVDRPTMVCSALSSKEIAFSASSDRRLKEEIVTVSLGKDFVNDLKPVQYHRINNSNDAIEMGIIAQELLVVLEKHGLSNSGMVSQPKDSQQFMSVRYNDLLAPMIKALQELSAENEILKSEVKRIDESLGAIKAMLSSRSR